MPRLISTSAKVFLAIVLMPLALIAGIISSVFGLKAKLSASEVATYLRNFIEGGGDEWDWDDFTSVPIANPSLESIRLRATKVELPVSHEGMRVLQELLSEAEALASHEASEASHRPST
jgi:hypothetical protein